MPNCLVFVVGAKAGVNALSYFVAKMNVRRSTIFEGRIHLAATEMKCVIDGVMIPSRIGKASKGDIIHASV